VARALVPAATIAAFTPTLAQGCFPQPHSNKYTPQDKMKYRNKYIGLKTNVSQAISTLTIINQLGVN
jgi:hypothetical protein